MCPPVLMAISGIASGVGSLMQSGAQKAGYKANAAANRREAQTQDQIGFTEASKVSKDLSRVTAQQIAGSAANGIDISGSVVDVITDSAREADLDIQTIKWNAGQRKDKALYESRVDEMNAKTVSRAAPFGFLSPILDSAVKIGGMYGKAA